MVTRQSVLAITYQVHGNRSSVNFLYIPSLSTTMFVLCSVDMFALDGRMYGGYWTGQSFGTNVPKEHVGISQRASANEHFDSAEHEH